MRKSRFLLPGLLLGALSLSACGTTELTPAQEAHNAVRNYLAALQDGDAEAAKRYIVATETDNPLLTDDVLEKSLAAGEISNIKVTRPSDEETTRSTVEATFDVGDQHVSVDYLVTGATSQYKISNALVPINLSPLASYQPTVNGVEVPAAATAEGLEVFPGTYDIALADNSFQVKGGGQALALADQKTGITATSTLAPELKPGKLRAMRTMIRNALDRCAAMTGATTPCGMGVPSYFSDYSVVPGSVTRKITAGTVNRATPALSTTTPHEVRVGTFSLTMEFRMTKGGSLYETRFPLPTTTRTAVVNFSGAKPKLRWTS